MLQVPRFEIIGRENLRVLENEDIFKRLLHGLLAGASLELAASVSISWVRTDLPVLAGLTWARLYMRQPTLVLEKRSVSGRTSTAAHRKERC